MIVLLCTIYPLLFGSTHSYPKITTTTKFEGTTPSIKKVFHQRCRQYINETYLRTNHTHQDVIIDCTALWLSFKHAWAQKDPCQVKTKDYEPFFNLVDKTGTPDGRILLWSGLKEAALEFTHLHNEYQTMEKTLPGYLTDDLSWCGCSKTSTRKGCKHGINYGKCDHFYGRCSASKPFWAYASRYFTKKSNGVAYIMLNKEYKHNPESFFRKYQLPEVVKMAKEEILTRVEIYVVVDWAAPPRQLNPVNLRLKCLRKK